jgi:hypothetical protein
VKRLFDLIMGLMAAAMLLVPIVIVAVLVQLTSPGPGLYWSDRVGRHNKIFKMPKFRSMRVGTPALATHLLANPKAHITPIGSFLRKSSLDELPQLWSILVGDISFVGPRPAFGAPLRHWLRHELRDLMRELLSDARLARRGIFEPKAVQALIKANEDGRVDASYTLFSMICIEVWCQRFMLATDSAPQIDLFQVAPTHVIPTHA